MKVDVSKVRPGEFIQIRPQFLKGLKSDTLTTKSGVFSGGKILFIKDNTITIVGYPEEDPDTECIYTIEIELNAA